MSDAILKIDTGFVGAVHECDLAMSIDEWKELSPKDQTEIIMQEIWEFIEAYVEDEDGNIVN